MSAADLSVAKGRIAALHSLFLSYFDRHDDEAAVKLLKAIRDEAQAAGVGSGESPTASKVGRLTFWSQMYARAAEHPLTLDRALLIMREIRAEK